MIQQLCMKSGVSAVMEASISERRGYTMQKDTLPVSRKLPARGVTGYLLRGRAPTRRRQRPDAPPAQEGGEAPLGGAMTAL